MLGNILNNLDLFTVLTFFFVLLLTYIIWDNFYGIRVNIPGPTPWPIVGNLPNIVGTKNAAETFMKLQKKYGNLVFLRLGTRPFVVVFGYKKIREILVENGNKTKFRPRGGFIKKLFPNDVQGVAVSNGQEWSDIRKFTIVALKYFGMGKKSIEERINEEAGFLVDLFYKQSNKPTDVSKVFSRATSNIISNIIFGSRFEYDNPDFNRMLENVAFIFKHNALLRPETIFPILDKILPSSKVKQLIERRHQIQSYIETRIDEQRKTFDPQNIRNLLDLYLEQEGHTDAKMSDERLFLTITDLYIAGTDTTSVTLQWSMLYMLKYPDVQKTCRDQILEVIGDRIPVVKDKDDLPYVMATLYEVQRIATIAPMGVAHSTMEDIHIDGKIIPKGTDILCSLMSIHFDPEMWDEPDVFRPERFLGPDGQFLKHEAFSAFSMGPRICLGKQLAKAEGFLFFTAILQRFDLIKSEENYDLPTMGIHTGATLQPQPFKMCFRQRT